MGSLSAVTGLTTRVPTRDPSGKVTLLALTFMAKPARPGMVRMTSWLPPTVLTDWPLVARGGRKMGWASWLFLPLTTSVWTIRLRAGVMPLGLSVAVWLVLMAPVPRKISKLMGRLASWVLARAVWRLPLTRVRRIALLFK